jgi:hypothetical protein
MSNDNISKELMELGKLTQILDEDVKIAFDRLVNNKTDFDLRVFVRIVYSGIEGYLYFLRQMCLERYRSNTTLYQPHEVLALKEERHQIKENGTVDVKEDFMRFEQSFKFTLHYAFRDVTGLGKIDYNSVGWTKLKEGQLVRNRITHPKSADRMAITKDDYISVMEGFIWFRKILDENFNNSLAALREEFDQLMISLENAKKAT